MAQERFDVYQAIGEDKGQVEAHRVDEPSRSGIGGPMWWNRVRWALFQHGFPTLAQFGMVLGSGYYDINAIARNVSTAGDVRTPAPGSPEANGISILDLSGFGFDRLITTNSGRQDLAAMKEIYNLCERGTLPAEAYRRTLETGFQAMYEEEIQRNPDIVPRAERVISTLVEACEQGRSFRAVLALSREQGGLGLPVDTYDPSQTSFLNDANSAATPTPDN